MAMVVRIPLPADAPAPFEEIAAEPLGEGRYRLLAPPWITYQVAAGDHVLALAEPDGSFTYAGPLERSGHWTVRVLFAEGLGFRERTAILLALKTAGVRPEDPRGRYQAFDVAPTCDPDAVLAPLEAGAEAGYLEYEVVEPGSDEE
jgi:hypothetical protein